MEEKEFDFRLTFHGYTPVIEEEYTRHYIKLLVYKDEYYERWSTKYFWNFDLDDKFYDENDNELDNSELPPGFEEAFDEFVRTDSDLGNFDTVYEQELNYWNNDN